MAAEENRNKTKQRNFAIANAGSPLEHGKLPPQAVDLEEAVLGALMLEREAVNTAIDILQPKSFYKESHQKIFATIQYLFEKSQAVDLLTVTTELKKRGELDIVGGAYYVTQLTNRVASAANIEFHARVIAQKYILRELIRISSEIITNAYDDTTDVFNLLDQAESSLFSVAEGNIRKSFESVSELISAALKQIENAKNKESGVIGVPSGFTALDRVTSGWQPSDLVIIAARPAMGKTSYVLSLARNAAVDYKIPVAFFSLEMSSLQLVTRLISAESEISSEKLRSGNLRNDEIQQIQSRITELSEAPIFIDDTAGLSVFELRAKARRLKAKHNIQLLIIDYLQLMSGGNDSAKGGGNREQEISMISRSLKSIAKELSIPVLALSQLSRAVETRGGNKRPQLSDLRESGSIEQDADMVQFIHRAAYYGITEDEDGNPTDGKATIIIAKHRNGAVCDVNLKFVNELAKFMDNDENSFEHGDFPQSMQVNVKGDEFDSGATIVKSSKMNDINDDFDDFNPNLDDAPF
ncbi:MAG: replicative DNA helicase [Flavobacteriales bacterium]|jgi:replicative DNA helicase|nr:replicative DNA helicase [Flavobacteriales bacterium]MDF1676760.1 replicative DNA helicase [Vicingaceae bacterium]MBQ21632.1 replicative DNA helicase [Flavobacteriales bacterium]MCW8898373.1 replicative DNA helicase [Flavobacteriales bacterium]MCW8913353.1 replicative DNA helicase [Flavobacteriales bacterium]|tara:strand:- start:10184 stop:11758 length:1575 start_codon:yes stop_codon:yes gene_type:complete